ncbi:MAG: CoA transferase [Chloroflexi bacterium]|nr:CoA transferase [Chloroflexota bacterium]MDA1147670.1 CoA transferase [Chloroflexota bacterium]
MAGPLVGLRVLDVSEGVAGPFCAKLLGDLGADVVKVESLDGGDSSRALGPFPGGAADPERSAAFFYFNTSKRGVTLDPATAEGRGFLERLVRRYDVVIAGETEGELAARGIGFEQLRAWNPRVILTTVSGFGSEGPHAGWAWSHLVACATGGWARTCGLPDREPLQAGGAITETLTGAFAAAATLLAVLGRRAHGQGEHIDVSAQQATLAGALFPSLRYEYSGDIQARNSQFGPGPSYILPAKDGYIGVNVLTAAQWELLCGFLGHPEIVTDPRYEGLKRREHAAEIGAIFADALKERSAAEVFHEGEAWRVPFGLVPSMAEIPELAPHRERGFFVELEHPQAGTVAVPGVPFKSTATAARPFRPPLLGEHNDEVARELEGAAASEAAVAVTGVAGPGGAGTSDAPPAAVTAPLEGLRILDLSMFFSGPLAMQIAGDAGADVIKVESVQRIDGWRASNAAGAERPWECSPNFNWVNRSKRGITLNLTDPRGTEILKRLVADADVLIENYTPRVMGNFGLDYETLRAINPRLIMMSMPGFGADVSWRDYVAFGMSTEQMAGISHLTGYAGEQPIFTAMNGGDPFVGVIAATVLFSALHHRAESGEGQHIDLSQVEACTLFVGDAVTGWTLAGQDPGRTGNAHPTHAPHGIYPCRDDGWIAIDCQDDGQWATLAGLIGRAEWASAGARWATAVGRLDERGALDVAIAGWTRGRGHIELMDALQAAGVAAGAVLTGPEILDDPQLAARGGLRAADRPGVGVKHYPTQPYQFRFAPPPPDRRAPMLGEHTNEVLRERLGMSDAELAALERDDVIGTVPIAAR